MRLVSKRDFEVDNSIFHSSRHCRDMLFQTDTGEYILHIHADGLGEKLLRLDTISALSWMNASPDEYGIEWIAEGAD